MRCLAALRRGARSFTLRERSSLWNIMRTLAEIEQQFPGAAENGLSADSVAQSTQRYGVNKLTPLPREPLWKKFLAKFDEPIIKILLAAALLSMFVDLFQSEKHEQILVAGVL